MEVVQSQPELSHVVAATHPPRSLSSGLDGRQQQRDKHSDNGDDHQQFHERKARVVRAATRGISRKHGNNPWPLGLCDKKE
jgi:hypothetical protein